MEETANVQENATQEAEVKETKTFTQEEMNKIDNCVNCRLCASRCPYELDTPNLLRKNLADYRNVLAGRASVQEHVHFGH